MERRTAFYGDERLDYYTEKEANQELEQPKTFLDLPLKTIFSNFSQTFVDILEDIANASSIREGMHAFVKKDRPIYVGVLLLLIAFLTYITDIF